MASAAATSVLSTMAALHLSRSSTGDFTLTCQGREIKAHTYVLANGSDYFKNLMTSDFDEKNKKSVDIKDCEAATLAITINFLYGVEVPPGPGDMQGLLKMADMFFIEELREEAGRRLAWGVCERNHLELSRMAETYRSAVLTAACAKFLVNREAEVDWWVLEGLPRLTAAVAKVATQVLRQARKGGAIRQGFKCKLCGVIFLTKDPLVNHIKTIHVEVMRQQGLARGIQVGF